MSEENVEIVRDAFAAFTRGDIQGVLHLCAEVHACLLQRDPARVNASQIQSEIQEASICLMCRA